jgi:hypothetical protein
VGRINVGRVILGGLVAGVVANVLDYVVSAHLLAEEMAANAQRRNLDHSIANSTAAMVTWIVIDFLYATAIVFTYAAIRPRFGPGPKTAVIAALIPWFSICIILFGLATMGFWPMEFFWKNAFYSAIVAMAAGLAGGAVYQEA